MNRIISRLLGKIAPSTNASEAEVAEYLSEENLVGWAKKSTFSREIAMISGLMKRFEVKSYVDIGANIGFVFLESLKVYGKPVTATLFEPVPQIFSVLKNRINRELPKDSTATAHNIGLGTSKVESTIYIDLAGNYGWNTMRRDKITNTMYPVKIAIDRLDALGDSFTSIDLMKIDVEGYESEVMKGGMEVIKKHQPVIYLELAWAKQNKMWQSQVEVLTELIENQGYTMHAEDNTELQIKDLEGTQDIILIPSRFKGK